jgi:hypothetical protein
MHIRPRGGVAGGNQTGRQKGETEEKNQQEQRLDVVRDERYRAFPKCPNYFGFNFTFRAFGVFENKTWQWLLI